MLKLEGKKEGERGKIVFWHAGNEAVVVESSGKVTGVSLPPLYHMGANCFIFIIHSNSASNHI